MIPAAVVVVVVMVYLLFGKLAGGERTPMDYVRLLRLPQANWRRRSSWPDLIQNDPSMASDPSSFGELTDLLSHELPPRDPAAEDPSLPSTWR